MNREGQVMKRQIQITALLSFLVLVFSPPVFSQDEDSSVSTETESEQTPAENTEVPTAQEVEINEDNYRQFMELRDARQQRNVMPEDAFKPGSGLQSLDDLPEDSQKHLRNQLREIILEGDQWQPGDEATEYPYTPSEAAGSNSPLEKQEKEAWGELVDGYHQREAEIYANSARSGAASAAGSHGSGTGKSQEKGAQDGGGEQSAQGEQSNQQSSSDQAGNEGSYSPGGSNDPNAKSTEGVSQNAMEFLKQLGNHGGNAEEGSTIPTMGSGGQGDLQSQASQQGNTERGDPVGHGSQGSSNDPSPSSTTGTSQSAMEFLQQMGNQGGNAEEGGNSPTAGNGGQGDFQAQAGELNRSGQDNPSAGDPQGTENQSTTNSATAGTSQNAMEFLQGQGEQDGDAGEGTTDASTADSGQEQEGTEAQIAATPPTSPPPVSPEESEEQNVEGVSQNALEYLMGDDAQSEDTTNNESQTNDSVTDPETTLSIEELLNAKGVGETTGTNFEQTIDDPERSATQDNPDEDGES